MGIEGERKNLDDILAEEKGQHEAIPPEIFTEWVMNGRVSEIHDSGIVRVMATLYAILEDERLKYLATPDTFENDLAEDYTKFLHGISSAFNDHKWEEPLFLFLMQSRFTNPEIRDAIRAMVNQAKYERSSWGALRQENHTEFLFALRCDL